MRIIASLLFLALLVLGVWTFAVADRWNMWLPENVSSFGPAIDNLFYLILVLVGIFFVLTEGVLVYSVFVYSKKRPSKATFSHGNHKLEMAWTAVPGVLLLVIAFAQMGTWADMKFKGQIPDVEPLAEVTASQFDWRFRYPGSDGELGTADDIESAFEFVVPVNEDVRFNLRSRDVIHSFFVPQFRLKQDAMPGLDIPVWFNATKEGVYDLVCAELCGWGHYKMAGRVRVVSRERYDEWMSEMTEQKYSNGSEEAN